MTFFDGMGSFPLYFPLPRTKWRVSMGHEIDGLLEVAEIPIWLSCIAMASGSFCIFAFGGVVYAFAGHSQCHYVDFPE
jgi:hypothetical protein